MESSGFSSDRSKELKKIWGVCIALILVTAVFAFFYGKSYQEKHDSTEMVKAGTRNEQLEKQIKVSQDSIRALQQITLDLIAQLKIKKVEYSKIETKYEKIDSLIRTLPFDGDVRLLADWLSKSDSLQRRHGSSPK